MSDAEEIGRGIQVLTYWKKEDEENGARDTNDETRRRRYVSRRV